MLLADGTLLLCTVAAGAMTPVASLTVPLGGEAGAEGAVRALPHPLAFGGALVVVEGASGFTLIDLLPRWGVGVLWAWWWWWHVWVWVVLGCCVCDGGVGGWLNCQGQLQALAALQHWPARAYM